MNHFLLESRLKRLEAVQREKAGGRHVCVVFPLPGGGGYIDHTGAKIDTSLFRCVIVCDLPRSEPDQEQ